MWWYAPIPLIVISILFLALYLSLRGMTRFRVEFLLLPAGAFLLAGVEDWYMRTFQPEINIRVDGIIFLGAIIASLAIGIPYAFTRRPHPPRSR